MNGDRIRLDIGSMSGGIALGTGSQATGAGGSIHGNTDGGLAALLASIRPLMEALPADRRTQAETVVAVIEEEKDRQSPDGSRIKTLLATLRSICEGTIGSIIADYLAN